MNAYPHGDFVTSLALRKDSFLSGDSKGKAIFWDLKKSQLPVREFFHNSAITSMEVQPTRPLVAVGLASGHIYLRDPSVSPELKVMQPERTGCINSLAFLTDYTLIAATSSGLTRFDLRL